MSRRVALKINCKRQLDGRCLDERFGGTPGAFVCEALCEHRQPVDQGPAVVWQPIPADAVWVCGNRLAEWTTEGNDFIAGNALAKVGEGFWLSAQVYAKSLSMRVPVTPSAG